MSPILRKPFSQVVCIRNATMLLFAIAPSLAYAKQQPYTIGELFGLLAVFAILIGPFAYLSWIGEKEEKEAAERRVRELEAERERRRNDSLRRDRLGDRSSAPLLAERHARELEAVRERKKNDPFRQDQLDDESAAPLLAEIGVGRELPADENS